MSPSQYKSRYINLRVDIAAAISTPDAACQNEVQTVSIRSYRNASMDSGSVQDEKNRLVSLMRRNRYSRSDRVAVARSFSGKATVAQCQRAVAAIWQLGLATSTTLQSYCDTYLGLDCSGFVNNYFLHAHNLQERNINSYYQCGRTNLRENFSEFRNKDVLIWCDNQGHLNGSRGRHIAVIDRVREMSMTGNDLEASVVESTGSLGLVESIYTFYETSKTGVYRIHRPLKPSTRNHVKVVPVIVL